MFWGLISSSLLLFARVAIADVSGARDHSPVLAGPITSHCLDKPNYATAARGVGRNVTIGGVPTYVSDPPTGGQAPSGVKKVITFYSDVYSPFNVNNQLVQDYFASQGFHVVGIDYFFGDPIDAHDGEPGFNQSAWLAKSVRQADESVPRWLEAVRTIHGTGPNVKYSAIGYCFGAPYSMRAGAGDGVVASRSYIKANETDATFSTAALRRAADILAQRKAKYHLQIFSGVTHGFATRADPTDENAVWAKDESARSFVEFFNRFSK